MRRTAAAVVVTTAGLIALLDYKSGSATTRLGGGRGAASSPALLPDSSGSVDGSSTGAPSTPLPAPLPSVPAAGNPPRPPVSARPATSTPATAPSGPTSQRVLDGPVIDTRYGAVQVEATVSGSRVVDVQALQLPNDRRRSVAINDYAAPILRREALAAQSAQIDTVSGASVTSGAYAQSLQAALGATGKS